MTRQHIAYLLIALAILAAGAGCTYAWYHARERSQRRRFKREARAREAASGSSGP